MTELVEVHVEAFAVLQKYLDTLPRDSYTKRPFIQDCVVVAQDSYEEGAQRPARGGQFPSGKVKYRAELAFPPCCRLRKSFQAADQHSPSEAKLVVARKAILALRASGQLMEDRSPARPARPELPRSQEDCLPFVLEDIAPGAKLALYRLEPQGSLLSAEDSRRFGLLGTWHSMYAFQFEAEALRPYCRGHPASDGGVRRQGTVRVEPVEMVTVLDEDQHAVVQSFHEKTVADKADDRACRAIFAVCLTAQGGIDWEATSAQRPVPCWLRELHRRLLRLQGLECLSFYAPVGPAPSPLRLEAVADRVSPAFEALRLYGRACLRMLTALARHVQHPLDDAGILERHLDEVLSNGRCAALIRISGFLGSASVKVCAGDSAEAAARLEALLGAYALEPGGEYCSVIRCWQWLTGEDELAMATRLIASSSLKYLGRTPTYETLREIMVDGIPTLEVYYRGKGTALYQRPVVPQGRGHGSVGTEKVLDVPEATWQEVEYDPGCNTFISPAFLYEDGRRQPLPNKIAGYLRGEPVQRLLTLRHYKEPTEHYDSLREMRDGWLEVRYTRKGLFRYRRCPRGKVGIECGTAGGERDEAEQPLYYSELSKTFVSPRGHLVPNKVVEWLNGKGLFQLVTCPKESKECKEQRDAPGVVITSWEPLRIEWYGPARGGQFIIYTCFARVVGGGLVYTMMDSTMKEEEELEYSEEVKNWVDGRREVLPPQVLTWMQRAQKATEDERVRGFVEHYAEMPWRAVPPCVNSSFPQLDGTDLAELESSLGCKFTNCALLLEALTHPSRDTFSLTPSNTKLAFLGSLITEVLVADILLDRASFCWGETVRQDVLAKSRTYAVPWPSRKWPDTPQEVPSEKWLEAGQLEKTGCLCQSFEELQSHLAACCSSIACSASATRLGLHKGLQVDSPELVADVRLFARVWRRAQRRATRSAAWQEVLAHGAPKALGDAFLAAVAAVALDKGNLKLGTDILRDHVHSCVGLQDLRSPRQEAELRTLAEMPDSEVKAALDVSKPVLNMAAVEEEMSPGGGSALRPPLQDMRFSKLQEENGSDWKLVCDVSPRTAKLRGHFHGAVVMGPCSDSDEAEPHAAKLEEYPCRLCNMTLNGPHQYQDHLKGKHHRKNMNKFREQGRTVFDRCGQVRAAASSASAPAGQPEGAREGQPEGCERQDEAWPFLAWSLEPDEAWPSTDSGTWFPPTPDSWCCLPPDFRLFGP